MVRQTEIYQTELEAKNDKLRSSQRHRDGWRPLNTNFTRNQWKIIWTNDPDPPPPPKRPLTQADFINELAAERNVRVLGLSALEPMTIKGVKKWYQFWK